MRIGFIGLGAMGAPMAAKLVAAGHDVRGFDVRPAAIELLATQGGQAAASARDAASGADLLWLMVVNGEQAESVLFGDGAAAAALPQGALVVAACTQAPAQAQALAARVAAARLVMLDAPVSGGVAGAKAAALTIMCSGPDAAVATARPVFEALAKRIFHVGSDAGLGSTAKMINQLLCGVHIAAAAEAMHVAERAGVPLATMHEIISVSAGNSWMWGDRGPRMMQDDPPVTSAVDIFVKDLGIVLDQGRRARQGLPLASAAMQMFLAASGLGHGAADDSQVIRAYRALNGKGVSIKNDEPAYAEKIWIGPSYADRRIFVLGESWFGDFPDDLVTDDGYIRAYLDGRVADRMYTKMSNASGLAKREFWEGVMFTNFVQRVGQTRDCKPTAEDYRRACPRLARILEEHKPVGVWILGKKQGEFSAPIVKRAGIACEVSVHPTGGYGVKSATVGASWNALLEKVSRLAPSP